MIIPENPIIKTPYINLQSDFGFKRAFGSKKFRKVVLRFIKAALGEEIEVTKVTPRQVKFQNKEVIPSSETGKRIVYDVYFTITIDKNHSDLKPYHIHRDRRGEDVEHHFIFEMQNAYAPPFEDRMAYYGFKAIAEQGKQGWNYDLDPVILVGITDFDFPHLSKKLIHDFELREKTSGETLTKKLRLLFYSLKQVPDKWEECKTDLQRQLYLIKNMDKMDKNSKPFIDGGYEEYFEAAESNNIVGEEAVAYSRSLEHLQEVQAGLDFQFKEGVSIGEQRGIAIGEQRGQQIERLIMAQKMKAIGYDISSISEITGLPQNEIDNL